MAPGEAYFASTTIQGVKMKILSILFLAALMNLGLAQDSEEDNQNHVYFIFGLDTQAFDPKLDFAVNKDTTGHFSTNSGISFNSGLGFRQVLGNKLSIRYQGNILEWMSVDFGNMVYDSVVADHSVEGNLVLMGPSASAFLDLKMGDSGNFLYLGPGIGYLGGANSYRFVGDGRTVDWENSDWTRTLSLESGIVLELKSQYGLTLGYKFTHIGDLDYKTSLDNDLNFALGGHHGFKVGFIHFFRKK